MKKRGKARGARRRPAVKDLDKPKASQVEGGGKRIDAPSPLIAQALR